MYRGIDDGFWVFTSGSETQEQMDDPDNTKIYSLQTMAELDPAIVPFLNSPPGSTFDRTSTGSFVPGPPLDAFDA